MKRSVTEVIRRGLDNALANWQLLALRFAENILFAMLAIGTAFAIIVPLAVSIGLAAINWKNVQAEPDSVAAAIADLLIRHWPVFVWVFVAILGLLTVLIVIHSFVIAACARTYVDGERSIRLQVFSMDRWLAGGRQSIWPVFWIYNLAYSVAGLIILIPALLTLVFMLALRESAAAIVIGCLGLLLVFFVMLVAFVISGIWCQKAIVISVARNLKAREALSVGWKEMRADFGRHFAVAFIMIVLSFGGAMTLGMFSVVFAVPSSHASMAALMFAPARMVLSMIQSVFTAAVGLWMLACFAAMSDSK